MSATPEAFIPLNGSAGNSAPVTGGKRHKLKLVTRKQARKLLKKMGRKMRGGAPTDPAAIVETPVSTDDSKGGRRHRGTKKTHRRSRSRRSLFGLKY